MTFWSLLILLGLSLPVLGQDQVVLRLNEQGIYKILKMAVQYNTATKEGQTMVVPQNIYKFTLPKSQLLNNPIIPLLNEISDINFNRDLDFFLNTSDIKVSGEVDAKNITTQIFNSHENGFDVRLNLSIPRVSATAAELSLCEDRSRNLRNCGSGLKATMSHLQIQTSGRPVHISLVLRLRTDGQVARVSVRSVDSNLETKNGPGLNVNFRSIEVPKISIVIDGQETELDTSRLKDEVLKRKNFLAQKLLSFAADFIASDVAEMLNVYLVNKEIATSYEVYRKDNLVKFDEFLSHHQDRVENKIFERPEFSLAGTDPGSAMMAQISEIIKNAQIKISLRKISTPGNEDIELSGLLNFILNNRQIVVKNTLGNSNRPLPALDLSAQRNFDINLAISEPLINGALDLANSTGLFQEIFEKLAPVPGVSIQNIKLHFAATGALVAVVNSQVDLNKLESKDIKSWFKRRIAVWLERNNNNSIIYFPIEISIIPLVKKTEKGMELELRILSPFLGGALNNRFKYPSNVPNMTDTVKDGVMDELKASLEPHTNKSYKVDVTKFLNQSGVVFQPKSFAISQNAYLMMNLDIVDIKFNSKHSRK